MLNENQLVIKDKSLFLNEFSQISINYPLYHLSYKNHDGEIFKPRVPLSFSINPFNNIDENRIFKRICFSSDISKCLTAMMTSCIIYNNKCYVHVIENQENVKVYKPTKEEVFDVEATDEVWIREPVKLKCIGRILVTSYSKKLEDFTMVIFNRNNENVVQYYPKYRWKWVEKYE